ncbi:PfkB family carbohydrate kinase [Sorangium cellulosum]|uniref:PfkB family carbohydrate kinase n=1 Tax=Sorangium cellulosum TaxID=56 RepID=UPI003D9A11D8
MTVPVIVGTGLIALDVVFQGDADAIVRQCAGGTTGNVLTILRYLGWKSVPVARLADDRARAVVQADLMRWGVDVRFLGLAPQTPTPIIVERVLRTENGEAVHRFSWTCPCCGAWLPRYRPVGARASEQVVSEIPVPTVFFFDRPSPGAVALARNYAAAGALVMFEPSASGDRAAFEPALAIADIVKYSEQRFAKLPAHRPSGGRRLEIQTLGVDGLRYRIGTGRRAGSWRHLPAIAARDVSDTAGAGDWCTAGLLTQVAAGARSGFAEVGDEEVEAALRYGQALSAWNCRFEGARGGMYDQSRRDFEREVDALLKGSDQAKRSAPETPRCEPLSDICPSCPQAVECMRPLQYVHKLLA